MTALFYSAASASLKLFGVITISVACWFTVRRVMLLTPGCVTGLSFDGFEHIIEVVPKRRLPVIAVWIYVISSVQIMACRHLRTTYFLVVCADSTDRESRRQLGTHLRTVKLSRVPSMAAKLYPLRVAGNRDNQQ
jgi:hypothetical protein